MLAYELAARVQRLQFPDELIYVRISLFGAENWQLVVANSNKSGFHGQYRLGNDPWTRQDSITPEIALTGTREISAGLAADLLLRFGWKGVTSEMITSIQDDVLGAPSP
jgi:hypothetical protein